MQANENTNLSSDDKVKINRKKGMSDICVAQSLLRDAFPSRRYGKVEAAFYEAHKFISRRVRKDFTMRRVRSIWEGTARRIDSEEMDALREAVKEEARREQIELRTRLAALDAKIAAYEAFANRPVLAKESEQAGR